MLDDSGRYKGSACPNLQPWARSSAWLWKGNMVVYCVLRCKQHGVLEESFLSVRSRPSCERASRIATQYIRAKGGDLGITTNWRQSLDIAVLATFMGQPKEGPSLALPWVTGIVSALTGRPVRNDLAMTGEITIMGKVLPVVASSRNFGLRAMPA